MVLTICVVSFLLDKICTGHVPGRPSYLLRPRRGFGLQMFPVCHVQFSHRNNKMSLVRSWWCYAFRTAERGECLTYSVKRQLYCGHGKPTHSCDIALLPLLRSGREYAPCQQGLWQHWPLPLWDLFTKADSKAVASDWIPQSSKASCTIPSRGFDTPQCVSDFGQMVY